MSDPNPARRERPSASTPPRLSTEPLSALAPLVAPSLARAPGQSPILALHDGEDPVAFGAAGTRTADQLRRDVARVAAVLPAAAAEQSGEASREILCVASDRYHFTVALLAAWQRGHRVALPPNAQSELLRALADDPAISLVIHDTDEMTGLDLRPLLRDSQTRSTRSEEPFELAPLAASRGLVSVWTSGSTGQHQRHRKTAGQLFSEALVLAEHFGLAARDEGEAGPACRGARVAATVPSHHIYGLLFSVLVPLVGGGSFLRETPLHAGVVRGAVEDADVLVSVPAHLRALRILDAGQLPVLDRVFSSGAPLPPATASMVFERFGMAVTEVLGSTETGGIASRVSGPPQTDSEAGAPWEPLPHVALEIDDEDGRLSVDSPFLPPEGPRPWRTADRVELASTQPLRFRHLGRVDGVVKIGGKRVALAEIERRLFEVPGVEDAAVAVVEVGGARGRETVAVVVAPGLSPELLRHELRRWLDPVVVPRRMRFVDALPRERNGKLTRERLLETIEGGKHKVRTLECTPLSATDTDAGTVAEYALYVPRDLFALRGHFRRFPLVPGVVELDLAREQAALRWPELGRLARVLRLKFVRPLRPGEHLRMRLTRRKTNKVDFCLYAEIDAAGSGSAEDRVGVGQLVFEAS
ncbi:Putative AMP-dependent synthetase and ligase [Plesiocystis pacifica SIR-1]|uniref:Putative AMP-dependent synthetase and ligase n=1 Tax=Plesiocystis pacifica SIR-1 TaxID=391625 RepID=A6GBC7_9BACT|nr:AMP-binding protein [Plesiocystis pacifica]EDM76836.1 Putative AMP-dependent synthetase and ligase [Plesiocystis pacifica SIR-1]